MSDWHVIGDSDRDGHFLYLALGRRVTFGYFDKTAGKRGSWLSWDGGFTRNALPTHAMPLEDGLSDWIPISSWTRRHGFPAPPEPSP